MSTSGHDTPPLNYMTPNSHRLNSSINLLNGGAVGTSSQASLHLGHPGAMAPNHNRNLSHNSQLQQLQNHHASNPHLPQLHL